MLISPLKGESMLTRLVAFGLTRRPIVLLGLFGFAVLCHFAFSKLNVEAYPNPAPVILEITAQAPGLSAEEMERYYTIPMEIGLYSTPGIANIRSTSFYGLSFVRVTFKYGVEFYFAYTQAALALQQNVSLPNNLVPRSSSSLVGEIYRYQVVGSEALRADQSAHGPGLDRAAPPVHDPRRGADQQLGRYHQGIRRRGGSSQARGVQRHLSRS